MSYTTIHTYFTMTPTLFHLYTTTFDLANGITFSTEHISNKKYIIHIEGNRSAKC